MRRRSAKQGNPAQALAISSPLCVHSHRFDPCTQKAGFKLVAGLLKCYNTAWGGRGYDSDRGMATNWRLAVLLALCLAPLALCADPVASTADTELKEKLEEAIEAQQFGEDVTQDVKAKIIKEAPVGVLTSGTGDVSTTGESDAVLCTRAICCNLYCKGLPPSRLASAVGSAGPRLPLRNAPGWLL